MTNKYYQVLPVFEVILSKYTFTFSLEFQNLIRGVQVPVYQSYFRIAHDYSDSLFFCLVASLTHHLAAGPSSHQAPLTSEVGSLDRRLG